MHSYYSDIKLSAAQVSFNNAFKKYSTDSEIWNTMLQSYPLNYDSRYGFSYIISIIYGYNKLFHIKHLFLKKETSLLHESKTNKITQKLS